MLSAVADHLWQSLLLCALGAALALLVRHSSAAWRLWTWRVCLLKFLVPFALLHAAGEWLGLPSRYSGNPVPAELAAAAATVTPWLAPVRSAAVSRGLAFLCLVAALLVALACLRFLRQALRAESAQLDRELLVEQEPPPPGFLRAMVIASCALATLWIPLLGGAITDRAWRYDLLVEHIGALRAAPIRMSLAAPGMGSRMRVVASPNGVLIRNANVRELIAVSYGVSPFGVWSDQMYNGKEEAAESWMVTSPFVLMLLPRPSCRISAAVMPSMLPDGVASLVSNLMSIGAVHPATSS